jgi:cysteine desulfurase
MDYQATTPVDPRVLDEMIPFFTEKFGNASSRQHRVGWVAEEAVENARASIAAVIGASPKEVIFTSGATESNNLAIKGTAESLRQQGNHIITVQTEHHSVLDSCKRLARQGFDVTVLPVPADGILNPDELISAIRPGTILVSVMFANNEIGVLQPVARIGALCHERGIIFHCDATQGIGRMPLDVQSMGIDLLSSSGHKIYGPKGIGILYVRSRQPRVRPVMQMDGGGHENGLRSGTLNVPSIVGYAKALRLCADEMHTELERLWQLHHRIISGLRDALGDVPLNGHASIRLPHNINLSIPGIDNNTLMMSLKDIAMSTGSACSTSDPEPSHVLKALRLNQDRLHSSIRLGIGRFTTDNEADIAVRRIAEAVTSLRASSRRSPSPETVSVN